MISVEKYIKITCIVYTVKPLNSVFHGEIESCKYHKTNLSFRPSAGAPHLSCSTARARYSVEAHSAVLLTTAGVLTAAGVRIPAAALSAPLAAVARAVAGLVIARAAVLPALLAVLLQKGPLVSV